MSLESKVLRLFRGGLQNEGAAEKEMGGGPEPDARPRAGPCGE